MEMKFWLIDTVLYKFNIILKTSLCLLHFLKVKINTNNSYSGLCRHAIVLTEVNKLQIINIGISKKENSGQVDKHSIKLFYFSTISLWIFQHNIGKLHYWEKGHLQN